MRIRLTDSPPRGAAFTRVAFLHDGRDPGAGVPAALRASLRSAVKAAAFRGRTRQRVPAAAGWALYGLGKAPVSPAALRTALRRAIKDGLSGSRRKLLICFDSAVSEAAFVSLLPHLALADYAFNRYKTGKDSVRAAEAEAVVVPPPSLKARSLAAAVRSAEAVADAVRWARDMGNLPGNDLGPQDFAREVRALCGKRGLRLRILDKKEIEREKMGGLLGVNAGSA